MTSQPSVYLPGSNLPEGTLTFLFTDIEGSTRLLEQLHEQYAILLDDQRRILRAAFVHWNGTEIDTQGDSFFAVFQRAIDAVCCVMEAQHELTRHEWPHGAIVGVRMGLHTGEPIQVHAGYVGMDVHRAARIASAGHGGQVLISQSTRELIFQDLPKGASLRDLGQHKLKDIRYPQQIYQLEIDGLTVEFPPLKTLSTEEESPTPGEAPYRGLNFFNEADAEWFFGREQATSQLIKTVHGQRFLAVIGASGSGKSSVIRAGLVPGLKRNQPGHWQVHIITPSSHPLESLAISLTRGDPSVTAAATLMDDLRSDPRSLHLYIRRSVPQDRAMEVLLIIDQFEELFTLCRDEAERQAYVDNLLYAIEAENSPLRTVIALRADFYQHLAQYSGLRTEVAKHQDYLGAMENTELRHVIEEPARRGGWEFSPGLVDLIMHEIGATEGNQPEPGALPLLSHALLETWKRRRANMMNLRAYSEAGGVRGAIARTAESLYYGELTTEQQQIARSIFLRLTELGEGTQDTRRRVMISELLPPAPFGDPKIIEEVLVKLADARLITTGEGTAEVAHEALIREWPLLREWLAQDREGLRLHRHMTESAQEWDRMDRDPGALYRGARLAQALEWVQINPGQLNAQEQNFLDISQAASVREVREHQEQIQRELLAAQRLAETQSLAASRLRRRAVYLLAALGMAAILAVVAIIFGQRATQNALQANRNQATAQKASTFAISEANARATQQVIAESEALTRATAEANALHSRQIAEEQANLATSRELAAGAINNLKVDPERSILLALEALKKSYTLEAENALHQALLASRMIASIPAGNQSVFGVAVSPDGSKFAAADMDGTLKVWAMSDLTTLSHASPLLIVDNQIDFSVSDETSGMTLAFNPDGTQLAVIAANQSAKIYDASNGKLLQTFSAQNGNVYSISYDPAGKRLVTTSSGGVAIVWDTLSGTEQMTVTVPDYAMYAAIFTPDGRGLITGSDDAVARFWDLESSPVKELFSVGFDYSTEGPPTAFAFSPDGHFLAIGAGIIAKVWDFQALKADPSVKPLFTLFGHQNSINSLVYTQDGSHLVTGSADGTAKVWDAASGQELFTLAGGTGMINSLAISPDGIHPLSAHKDGLVRVWDISPTGSHEWWTVYPAYRSRFSQDGKHLATAYKTVEFTGETRFQIWAFSPSGITETTTITVDPGARVSAYAFSPDLSHSATVDTNMMLKVWDSSTGQLAHSIPISQTGTTSGHSDYVFGLDFSPDGTHIATGSDDGNVIVWDLASGKSVLTLTGHKGPVRGVSYSPDGTRLATASFDGTAGIWDTTTGQLLKTLSGHEGMVIQVKFSPDGKRILTSSSDSTAKVWNVQTGQELLTLKGHVSSVFWVDINSDGTRYATGSTDGKVIVWDASTGRALLTLPGFFVQFAPDGMSLMAISLDDLVGRGYYLDIQKLITLARSRVTRSLTTLECQQYLHVDQCPTSP